MTDAMKITTQRDLIRTVSKRWRAQYEPFNDARPPFDKSKIAERLDCIDAETATPIEIAEIIGNSSWTRLICDECGEDVEAVITVGQEPDYESQTASICKKCLDKAVEIFGSINKAAEQNHNNDYD